MIVSRQRNEPAPYLFPNGDDMPIVSMAETRNLCGDFCERLTCALTGAVRLRTDSRADICPDLRFAPNVYGEVKSVGRNASSIIYKVRHERELNLCLSSMPPPELFYWLFHHSADCRTARTRHSLYASIAATLRFACVLSLAELSTIIATRKLRTLCRKIVVPSGARNGYGNNGYGDGWSIPLSIVAGLCTHDRATTGVTINNTFVAPLRLRMFTTATMRFGGIRQ